PAEDHVAKTEAAIRSPLHRGKKLLLVKILAAQHAIDIGHRNLDAVAGRAAHGIEHLLRCKFLRHFRSPSISPRLRPSDMPAIVTRRTEAKRDATMAQCSPGTLRRPHLPIR